MSYRIDNIMLHYPTAADAINDLISAMYSMCYNKFDADYSEKRLERSIKNWLFKRYWLPYLDIWGKDETALTTKEVQMIVSIMIKSFPQELENLDEQSSEYLQWLLFGDDAYNDLTGIYNKMRFMANDVQYGDIPCKDQLFYDKQSQNICSLYESMTGYGQRLATPLIREMNIYLQRICPSAKVPTQLERLIASLPTDIDFF